MRSGKERSSSHKRRHKSRQRSKSKQNDRPVSLDTIKATTTIDIESDEEIHTENDPQALLLNIIRRKKRKEWAKVVAPVEKIQIEKHKAFFLRRIFNSLPQISAPHQWILNRIEYSKGPTVQSYFRFILWLFYLNISIFIICFCCIVLPTFIYPEQVDFYSYVVHELNRTGLPIYSDYCNLNDERCAILGESFSNSSFQLSDPTCLEEPLGASACCSLYTEQYFSSLISNDSKDVSKTFTDFIDGSGVFSSNRLFIGYYKNLTRSNDDRQNFYDQFNMGLAVFLANMGALLVSAIFVIRSYGTGLRKSYTQTESVQNNIFQQVFSRWDFRVKTEGAAQREKLRFKAELDNIFLEYQSKKMFKFENFKDRLIFQLKRIGVWMFSLLLFAGCVAAIYFANRFTFQQRASRERGENENDFDRAKEFFIDYLPSITVSLINIGSQFIFAFIRDLKLYTRTTSIKHYLVKVILMRLLILFIYIFIIILQINCNGNQCALQTKLAGCNDIQNEATFIHCWETLLGQMIYRLMITDTVVLLVTHLIVDPIRSLLTLCRSGRKRVASASHSSNDDEVEEPCFLFKPLEFEIANYVLDLTYGQAVCWHGILFSPFLPLIAALKNLLIFIVKLITLFYFRRKADIQLSPARARHIFISILLFSLLWALLPLTYFITGLKTSRGCGPFRVYNSNDQYYMYYSMRNLITLIPVTGISETIFKLTSAVVIIPLVLILILYSSILMIWKSSYRAASVELYKLLYSSHKAYQVATKKLDSTTL